MTVNPINELRSPCDSYLAVCHSSDIEEGVKRFRLFVATDVSWAIAGRQVLALIGLPPVRNTAAPQLAVASAVNDRYWEFGSPNGRNGATGPDGGIWSSPPIGSHD